MALLAFAGFLRFDELSNLKLKDVISHATYYEPFIEGETASQSSAGNDDSEPLSHYLNAQWSRDYVLLLISCHSDRKEHLKDINTKNKRLWEEISKEFQLKWAMRSSKMCETKFKNLKRSYVSCNTTGKDPKKCRFFDELHEIFSRDDAIQPKATCSNLDGLKRKQRSTSNEETSDKQFTVTININNR
ncbi:uncharacterized protein [Montipora foliosa]|uniref:uncharacterized protein n=1 Tax=Montipora foliosa TaxID=591990 RepID=UPI0035F16F89